ncbi:hypothetical protein BDZ89DRAFT_1098936 [Hymenopellis radicata]|nr:hypothetical protein BDZ89DRAFT_1098936 [Hymenopellis radicata]
MGPTLSKAEVAKSGIGESNVRIAEEKKFISSTLAKAVNTALMGRDKSRVSITAKLVADRILLMIELDLYAPRVLQSLTFTEAAILYIRTHFNLDQVVIMCPDAGSAKRFSIVSERLNNAVSQMVLVGHVKDKIAILVDDMADACGTIGLAARHLAEAGTTQVYAISVDESALEKLIVTNTLPQQANEAFVGKFEVIDIDAVLEEVIGRATTGSVSKLFHEVLY